jgi:hypothetical protein
MVVASANTSAETSNNETASSKKKQSQEEALSTLKGLSKGIQSLKSEVVDLSNNLRVMEEKLLFPSSTKYSVFVSTSLGQFFTLESVKLKLDGKLVATHVYSKTQRQSMTRGGIQKLYITNLNQGIHHATAFFTGLGPNGRAYKLGKTLEFEKGSAGEYLELALRDNGDTQEPIVYVKQW